MANLQNIPGTSALHGRADTAAGTPEGSKGAVQISDTGLIDKINLRCDAANPAIAEALTRVVGASLPVTPNSFHVSGDRSIIWLGPDEWLILAENGAVDPIIAGLDTPEAGHIAVTNVSDALGSIRLAGPHARDALAKHCALDFHASQFTPGMAQQTLLSHAGVTILCLEEDCFQLIGRSSFMPYIVDLLMDASIEYGYRYAAA